MHWIRGKVFGTLPWHLFLANHLKWEWLHGQVQLWGSKTLDLAQGAYTCITVSCTRRLSLWKAASGRSVNTRVSQSKFSSLLHHLWSAQSISGKFLTSLSLSLPAYKAERIISYVVGSLNKNLYKMLLFVFEEHGPVNLVRLLSTFILKSQSLQDVWRRRQRGKESYPWGGQTEWHLQPNCGVKCLGAVFSPTPGLVLPFMWSH